MSYLNDLNPNQREVVKAVEGPVLVIAGPGSGKTRVLTYRIAHLVRIGVPAYRILALTFTNKAAGEMRERIVSLVGSSSSQLWMGTFHSIFARLLRFECEKLGYRKNYSIYDTADSLGLIKNVMAALRIPLQQFPPQAVRASISAAKNRLMSPETCAQEARDLFEEKTAVIHGEYQKRLKHNNAMDFDDLLLKPIELFERHKRVLSEYQERFRFLLIDEYQDTNRAQYILLKLLASRDRNICVVGDDAQSIYGFRGADIRNILDFQRDYPDAKVFRLEQNYRSTKTILRAADQLIKRNREQIPKDLWTDNPVGEPIVVLHCPDDRDEGQFIVSKIQTVTHGIKIDFKEIAIMYRTNAQSRSLEDALRRNNIPYTIVGGVEFYQRKEIKDVLAYLKMLANPQDDESLLRIINYPPRGIGDPALNRLQHHAVRNNVNLLNALDEADRIEGISKRAAAGFASFRDLYGKYAALIPTMSLSELCRALVDETGILRLLKEEGTPEAMARWENVQELLSAITEYGDRTPTGTLEQFLEEISLLTNVDRWDTGANSVTLMTLHSAKGLEFDVVFITGLEEGLLPFYTTVLDEPDLEEERRLLYVGITRAQKQLFLTHTRHRYRFGDITYPVPSRFLEELDASMLVHEGAGKSIRSHYSAKHRTPKSEFDQTPEHGEEQYFSDGESHPEGLSGQGELRAGMTVEHDVFGAGRIVALSGRGSDLKAVVDFPAAGRKSLMLRYAKLRIVE